MNDRESQHRRIVIQLQQENSKVDRELSIYRLMIDQAQGVIENLQKAKQQIEIELQTKKIIIEQLK